MADTPPITSSAPSTPPSSAADQARIRKERREAKIKAGGSARLNKISGLGGGLQREAPPPPPTASSAATAGDPDEVDISEHFYQPAATARPRGPPPNTAGTGNLGLGPDNISEDQLRAMMLGFTPSNSPAPPPGSNPFGPPGSNPFAGFAGMDGSGGGGGLPNADDPIMKMMQQMLGGGQASDGPGGMASFPGMAPMGLAGQQGASAAADATAYVWRIVHAVFALGLGLYMAVTTPFTGTKLARELSAFANATEATAWHQSSIRFFYIFATAEVLLQTSRFFFFEKGRAQTPGVLGMVMGFLPEPWKGYLALVLRYSRIWTTVSADAMVCVFVLGVAVWLRT